MKLSTVTGIHEDVRTNSPSELILVNDRFVGIECEVENYTIDGTRETLCSLISCKEDGSLRNFGREIVTIPVKGKDIVSAIDEMLELFSESATKVECSPRCGLHVHIDMRDCTTAQLNKVLALFCIMEGGLFKYCGANRDTNPYCVPLNNNLISMPCYKDLFDDNSTRVSDAISRSVKYTSLNLLPLFRYGTIEVRMHEGTIDKEEILEWVNMLLCLVDYGITFKGSAQDIVDSVCNSFPELVHKTFREVGIKSTSISGQFFESALEGARNFQQILISYKKTVTKASTKIPLATEQRFERFGQAEVAGNETLVALRRRVGSTTSTPPNSVFSWYASTPTAEEVEEIEEIFDEPEEPEEDNN